MEGILGSIATDIAVIQERSGLVRMRDRIKEGPASGAFWISILIRKEDQTLRNSKKQLL
jgi:hypothetical protein